MKAVIYLLGGLFVAFVVTVFVGRLNTSRVPEGECIGPPLRTDAKRREALDNGFHINPRYDCVLDEAPRGRINI